MGLTFEEHGQAHVRVQDTAPRFRRHGTTCVRACAWRKGATALSRYLAQLCETAPWRHGTTLAPTPPRFGIAFPMIKTSSSDIMDFIP